MPLLMPEWGFAMRHLPACLLYCSLLIPAAPVAVAQAPQGTAFTYQGVLKQNGVAVSGNTDMVFSLFDAAAGGNAVGTPVAFTAAGGNPVNVENGIFDVTLDFGAGAFIAMTVDQRYLEVAVNGTVLSPRTPIQNAPYALQAQAAELAYSVSNASIGSAQIIASQVQQRVNGTCGGGAAISAVNQDGSVNCQSTGSGSITSVAAGRGLTGGGSSGDVSLGITDPLFLAGNDANGVIYVQSTSTTGAIGIQALISDSGTAMFGNSSATTGSGVGVEGAASAPQGVAVSGINDATSGLAVGTRGQSASPAGLAVAGYANAKSGANAGVFGQTDSPAGYGIYGRAADTLGAGLGNGTGVYGESSGGSGVVGTSNALVAATPNGGIVGINTNNGWGVYGQQNVGPGGAGVRGDGAYAGVWGFSSTVFGVLGVTNSGSGVDGFAYSATGVGVSGSSNYIGVSGGGFGGTATYGVYGTGTTGVYGTGASYGVFGTGPTGVRGESPSTTGFGVAGVNTGGGSSISWGVYAQNVSSGGYAVEGYNPYGVGVRGNGNPAGQFIGNVNIQGTLSKTAGSFKIDHPLDPANKYLYHSFVESPDMKNIYDGVATLDASGQAWVDLPDYFEALNRDFRYQLTAIGRAAPGIFVADEISANRFRIAGGAPGQRVSWQVTGTRRDAYAEAHRIPVEVDKTGDERGTYLFPDLFGEPMTRAADAQLRAAATARATGVARP